MAPPTASMASSSSDLTLQNNTYSATETTALLLKKSDIDITTTEVSSPLLEDDAPSQPPPPGKPFPKLQIFLLCFARTMEPIAFFCIFPFIAEMVKRNGNLPYSDVGFYSGLIESLFSATQMVVLIFWGRLADRVGRKPVLLWSLVGMGIGSVCFTTATTIWQMILFRCLAGVFSGSGLVIRTMLSDHSTQETQAVAFSWFAFASNVGIFLGTITGGMLADPVNLYPGVFKGITLLEKYPYALAGFAIGGLNLICIGICVFFLEDTLKPEDPVPSSTSTSGTATPPQKLSTTALLKSPGVFNVIWVYSHFMFLAFAFTAIMPVLLYTPISLGGIGFSPFRISVWMAIQGASQAIWLILAFPFLQRRMGTKGVLGACATAYPFFFALFIVMNSLLRIDTETTVVWFWILAFVSSSVGPGVSMAFTGVQLALNDVSPNPHIMGTLNAIALTASSAIRSIVPGASTAIFAIGVRNQILWGNLAWAILIPISMCLNIFIKNLPDEKKQIKEEDD